jgi:trimeric autotransporter adhesin
MPVPYTFGTATAAIPLSQLDSNFATAVTIGNTAVQLGNTVTTLNNLTLANVTISSGNVTITNVAVTTANVSGTANVSTMVIIGNESVGGNTTVTGNISANNATLTTNLTLSGGTANGVAYLNTSKVLTTGTGFYFDGTNVGIGTTSPLGKLNLANAGSAVYQVYTNTAGAYQHFYIGNPSNALTFGNSSLNGSLSPSEFMRIDSSGNLLVGATSASGRLTVYPASNAQYGAYIQSQSSGDVGNAMLVLAKYDNNTTTSQIFAQFRVNSSTLSGYITANGANAATFTSSSDERLKENIVDLPSQLNNIMSLRPVEFDYKDGSGHQIGFIAQEMQTVYQDVVAQGADEYLMVSGWSKTEARLVKAIQEQQALIQSLTTRLTALENK